MNRTINISEIIGIPFKYKNEKQDEYIKRNVIELTPIVNTALVMGDAFGWCDLAELPMDLDEFCEEYVRQHFNLLFSSYSGFTFNDVSSKNV